MTLRVLTVATSVSAEHFLQGRAVGSNITSRLVAGRLHGLNGLTFTVAGNTTTFLDAPMHGLTTKEVTDALAADGTTAEWVGGALVFASGATVAGTGTANPKLGFPSKDITKTVWNPPDGVAPRCLSVNANPQDDGYTLYLEDV